MLEYFGSVDHPICLVSIDFAGLTSRANDIVELVKNNPSVKEIVVDTFTISNEIFLIDSSNLKANEKLLENFNCRRQLNKRSK